MKWTTRIILIFVICVLIGLGFALDSLEREKKPTEVPVSLVSKGNHSYEEKISDWVYAHSSRTSKDSCLQIVMQAMKYEQPLLLLSIMEAESEFSPTAVSSADAIGAAQIRWSVWGSSLSKAGIAREKRDLYDIYISMRAMDFIMRTLLSENKGDPTVALEKYLGGKDGKYLARISKSFMTLSLIKK
jgi:hypothetical protein